MQVEAAQEYKLDSKVCPPWRGVGDEDLLIASSTTASSAYTMRSYLTRYSSKQPPNLFEQPVGISPKRGTTAIVSDVILDNSYQAPSSQLHAYCSPNGSPKGSGGLANISIMLLSHLVE